MPTAPASHGSDAAKTLAANGQSCLPGWAITAHAMPAPPPSPHSELAAMVWSPGLLVASRPPSPTAPVFAAGTVRCCGAGWLPEIANQPDTPVYGPCLVITVVGSNAAHCAASPP